MKKNKKHSNDTKKTRFGVVYKRTIGNYEVRENQTVIRCSLSTLLRKELASHVGTANGRRNGGREVKINDNTDPVAIGDEVRFVQAGDGTGMIVEVLPRRNKLARQSAVPMPSARPFEQVIVANVDQVVPVFSAAFPSPSWGLLDRYLVSAEAAGIPALICITKTDLIPAEDEASQEELEEAVSVYRSIGYPVILTSTVTGEGVAELWQALQGRVSVLLGKSGVGKSSLLNALQPGLGLRVNEISRATGKGKHTTSHLEMFPFDSGGAIVDTPGIREFGLWDVSEDDLAYFFPEMEPYVGQCRFGLDCRHDEEPGCAIRKAVTAGRISPHRYQSYMRLRVDA